jgi:hypothetical protein
MIEGMIEVTTKTEENTKTTDMTTEEEIVETTAAETIIAEEITVITETGITVIRETDMRKKGTGIIIISIKIGEETNLLHRMKKNKYKRKRKVLSYPLTCSVL